MAMYVIQVEGGREAHVCDLINKLLGDRIKECFVPRREIFRREAGEWTTVRETLFPGYLFVETDDVSKVMERLARVPAFTRLLGKSDERVIPLSQDEVAWLTALMQPLDKVVEMSTGVIEGDRVIVTSGPLVGREALISGPRGPHQQDRSPQAAGLPRHAHVRQNQDHKSGTRNCQKECHS